ncbi:MAG: DUF423 domain-containing protein [Chlamydiota bacterium]|nr:DUF423 domain-containing protein [Chlamydiota bacterium]
MIENIEVSYWQKLLMAAGAFSLFIAICAGSFGAHYLKGSLSEKSLETFEIGIKYQFYQSISIMVIALSMSIFPSSFIKISGILMLLGVIVFSGSLYMLTFTGIKLWGAVTPIGGVTFLIAWMLFIIGIFM